MLIDYDTVKFASIECRLQMSGELSVLWMIDGFIYAREIAKKLDNMYDGYTYTYPTVTDVLNLGKLIEPNVNVKGFRTVNVSVGYDVKMDWQLVPEQMVNLMEAVREGAFNPRSLGNGLSTTRNGGANEFFKNYEEIHPFRDGNGRTGAILFNWLNGTLDHPIWPDNCFNDPRRTVGYGA